MEFRWLQDFLAVAETGNFTRAAALRNTSQAAFSRRIQQLEAWFGIPLSVMAFRDRANTNPAVSRLWALLKRTRPALNTRSRPNAVLYRNGLGSKAR